MFYAKANGQGSDPTRTAFVVRARDWGASAGQTAAAAAQGVGSAAQTAAVGVGKGVRQGVYSVRVWAAPRLESAAGYTTTTVAPKVSSALMVTARQVRPEDVTQKKGRSVLTWSILAAAVVAAAGAAAALVRYRYRAAMAEGAEDDEFDAVGPAGETTGTPAGEAAPAGAAGVSGPAETKTDAEVNGRVSASGW